MAAEKGISIRDLINEQFTHLTEKVGLLATDVHRFDEKLEKQHDAQMACMLRQHKEHDDIWCYVRDIGDRQAKTNGVKCGEEKAQQCAREHDERQYQRLWQNEYLYVTKLIAAATLGAAIVAVVQKYW